MAGMTFCNFFSIVLTFYKGYWCQNFLALFRKFDEKILTVERILQSRNLKMLATASVDENSGEIESQTYKDYADLSQSYLASMSKMVEIRKEETTKTKNFQKTSPRKQNRLEQNMQCTKILIYLPFLLKTAFSSQIFRLLRSTLTTSKVEILTNSLHTKFSCEIDSRDP